MAEEATTIVRIITLAPTTVDRGITLLRNLTTTEKIHLVINFMNIDGVRFSETVELRELILRKNSNIHHLEVYNDYFEFLVQFLLANNGETKHFFYSDIQQVPIQLDQTTALSNAIRSNNNNNGIIESFLFDGCFDSREVFQPVWDALLTTNVQDISVSLEIPENNKKGKSGGNNLDFSNISTNTSLKKLTVDFPFDGKNLFHPIKGNTTLEELAISSQYCGVILNNRGKRAFIEMLLENTTLIEVTLMNDVLRPVFSEIITIQTKLNWIWKRYIIKRKERIAATAAATTTAILVTTANITATVDDDATVGRMEQENKIHDEVEKMKKIEDEKKMIKKKKEMNFWLKTFEKKPVICNELIYLYLRENADMYNSNKSSIVVEERKRKRQN